MHHAQADAGFFVAVKQVGRVQVVEDFLEKLNRLIPNQAYKKNNSFFNFKSKKNFQILKETKILHQKRKNLSKSQFIEFSILFLIINYFNISSKRLEELSQIEFVSEKNESLKKTIISAYNSKNEESAVRAKIEQDYKNLITEIRENSNIQLIVKGKEEEEILNLLDEFINDFKEQKYLRKIESLEKKLSNNLDEHSYSELIKLKSQLNSD